MEVEILTIQYIVAIEDLPDLLCVGVVVLGYVFAIELAVEGFLRRELGLCKPLLGVHIWADALA